MVQCVEFIGGQLHAVETSVENCAGFILLSATEYAQLAVAITLFFIALMLWIFRRKGNRARHDSVC